jgi:hypothetical protein
MPGTPRPRTRGLVRHADVPTYGLLYPVEVRVLFGALENPADAGFSDPARQRLAARFDMSLPENQRELDAVVQPAQVADDAGVPLIELAIAFIVNHPWRQPQPPIPATASTPSSRPFDDALVAESGGVI